MLPTLKVERTLWEVILPVECLGLPVELEGADRLLDDPRFFEPFRAHFDPVFGRPSIPIETYLRLMFLKYRYRLGYETLCRDVQDSISWQRFCQIPLGGHTPHPTTLMKITTRCGTDTVWGMTTPGVTQRLRLFDEGARRFPNVFRDIAVRIAERHPHLNQGFYMCPICLKAFRRESLDDNMLSIEHVPPQNQGGPFTKVLICTECNNRTGTELDVQLADRDRLDRIAAPGAPPEKVEADVSGVQVNAWISHSEELGSWAIVVDPDHNNPISIEAMRDRLNAPDETDINVRSNVAYDRRRWRLALLKIGYLIGFAQGGYSYVFRSNLQPIRDQIRHPDQEVIDLDTAVVHLDPASINPEMADVMDRWILTLTDLDGLAITLKNRMVLLPIDTDPRDFYSDLAGRTEPLQFNFRAISSWPRWPSYLIDDQVASSA